MDESLATWLSLRETADARARAGELTRAIAVALPAVNPLRVVDLASGTGANIRYLAARLRGPQRWLAVDRDATLLDKAPRRLLTASGECVVETRPMELAPLNRDLFAGCHLVTASALLDLVSATWINLLAERCRDAGAAVLFTLSYDGRSECVPQEPEDEAVREWFNAHQKASDKGFGQAAGPDAWHVAVRCLRVAGYDVRHHRSDWLLGPEAAELQRQLVDGWARAVAEIVPDQAPLLESWRARRLAHVDAGRSRIVVGHEDVAGWL